MNNIDKTATEWDINAGVTTYNKETTTEVGAIYAAQKATEAKKEVIDKDLAATWVHLKAAGVVA